MNPINDQHSQHSQRSLYLRSSTNKHYPNPQVSRGHTSRPSQTLSSLTNTNMELNPSAIWRASSSYGVTYDYTHFHSNAANTPASSLSERAPGESFPSCPHSASSRNCFSCILDRAEMRLLTDLTRLPFEVDLGTPSSASSNSSHMALTPTTLGGEVHSALPVVKDESRDMDMVMELDSEFSFSAKEYGDKGDESLVASHSTAPMSDRRFSITESWDTEHTWLDHCYAEPFQVPYPPQSRSNFSPEQIPQRHTLQPSSAMIYHQDPIYTPYDFTMSPAYTPLYTFDSAADTHPTSVSHPASSSLFSSAPSLFLPPLPSPEPRTTAQSPLTLHQPQPVRPIPMIPLSDLSSTTHAPTSAPQSAPHLRALDDDTRKRARTHDSGGFAGLRAGNKTNLLSPLSLLCQPVCPTVRYQLSPESAASTGRAAGALSRADRADAPADEPDELPCDDEVEPGSVGGFFCACGCMGTKHSPPYYDGWI